MASASFVCGVSWIVCSWLFVLWGSGAGAHVVLDAPQLGSPGILWEVVGSELLVTFLSRPVAIVWSKLVDVVATFPPMSGLPSDCA